MLKELADMAKEINEDDEQLAALVDNGLSIVTKLLDKLSTSSESKEIASNIAKLSKLMYVSFCNEGFSNSQATDFTAAILGKGRK